LAGMRRLRKGGVKARKRGRIVISPKRAHKGTLSSIEEK